jgi:hypothetical protein
MKYRNVLNSGRAALLALLVLMILPVSSFAQRRWGTRPYRSSIVVYQPRPRVVYQRRPVYTYRYNSYTQPFYSNQYYSPGYAQPYYSNEYYSYGYTQPYVVNPYGYATRYRYGYNTFRPRYQRNRFRVAIRVR